MDSGKIVRAYFLGEKTEAAWILAAGIVSLAAAIETGRRRGAR